MSARRGLETDAGAEYHSVERHAVGEEAVFQLL
jgi:hypothetical protein